MIVGKLLFLSVLEDRAFSDDAREGKVYRPSCPKKSYRSNNSAL